jgi:hypothetical protein
MRLHQILRLVNTLRFMTSLRLTALPNLPVSSYPVAMSANLPPWAIALREWRVRVFGSQPRMESATNDVLSQSKISRLERAVVHPIDDLNPVEFAALLKAFSWTLDDFTRETGIQITEDLLLEREAGIVELSISDYVMSEIVILSSEGVEMEKRNVVVHKRYANKPLFGFTNQQETVHGVAVGQSVKILSTRTVRADKMVLVRAGGAVILAYAVDTKANRVVTVQGLELHAEKLWGEVVEYLTDETTFTRRRVN